MRRRPHLCVVQLAPRQELGVLVHAAGLLRSKLIIRRVLVNKALPCLFDRVKAFEHCSQVAVVLAGMDLPTDANNKFFSEKGFVCNISIGEIIFHDLQRLFERIRSIHHLICPKRFDKLGSSFSQIPFMKCFMSSDLFPVTESPVADADNFCSDGSCIAMIHKGFASIVPL